MPDFGGKDDGFSDSIRKDRTFSLTTEQGHRTCHRGL